MSNCLEAFRELARREGITLSEARAALEHETGRCVDTSVWARWTSGTRQLPPDVTRVVNRYIAGYVLRQSGIPLPDDPKKLEAAGAVIADMFSPPEVQEDKA